MVLKSRCAKRPSGSNSRKRPNCAIASKRSRRSCDDLSPRDPVEPEPRTSDSYMSTRETPPRRPKPIRSRDNPKRNIATDHTVLIGPGRLGQPLGKLLAEVGVPIQFVAARKLRAARRAVEFIGRGEAIRLDQLGASELAQAKVVLLAVADSAIEEVAAYLADASICSGVTARKCWSGKVVLHTCGPLPATGPDSPLAALRARGASTGALHPFQTVPTAAAGLSSLRRCFWAIEGDAAALKVAARWVKLLDGIHFRMMAAHKTLYHAAAFLACPAIVALLDGSERLLIR